MNPLWIVNPKYKKMAGCYDKDKSYSQKQFCLNSLLDSQTCENEFGIWDYMITVPCGKCIACRTRIANEWKCRLLHEIQYNVRNNVTMYFITFTLDEEHYGIAKQDHYYFIRKWLERYRYLTGESLRHFIVTELGDKTGRLHYHGIVFGSKLSADELKEEWRYCNDKNKFIGTVQEKTASYIVKYILKPNKWEELSDWYQPRRYVSRGLGKCYCDDDINKSSHNRGTGKWYCEFDGYKLALPRYYRDKLFTEETLIESKFYYYTHSPGTFSIKLVSHSFTTNNWHQFVVRRERVYKNSLKRKMSIASVRVTNTNLVPNDEFFVEP